jgi:putative PIN family toxin of toxin-antitoxin system
MRAVLDTNVLISGLLWRGARHECLLSAEAGLYELVLAESIFEELRAKLIHKFGNSSEEADEILIGLRRCSTLVTPTGRSGWVPADPDDDKFIESALIGHADVIVSGDHHLMDLSTVEGVPILTPRQFLQRLANEAD